MARCISARSEYTQHVSNFFIFSCVMIPPHSSSCCRKVHNRGCSLWLKFMTNTVGGCGGVYVCARACAGREEPRAELAFYQRWLMSALVLLLLQCGTCSTKLGPILIDCEAWCILKHSRLACLVEAVSHHVHQLVLANWPTAFEEEPSRWSGLRLKF